MEDNRETEQRTGINKEDTHLAECSTNESFLDLFRSEYLQICIIESELN
jgi:hypothetical protein